MKRLSHNSSSFFKPKISRCPLCHDLAPIGQFCENCVADIEQSKRLQGNRCGHCHLPLGNAIHCPLCDELHSRLRSIAYAFDYIAPLDRLILQFKEAGRFQLASAFANLIARRLSDDPTEDSRFHNTVLVPVPSEPASLDKRGYNPAHEFAKQLSKRLNLPICSDVLHKHSGLFKQKSLSAQHRRLHMINRYYCSYPLGRQNVILVDDVLTTGATLQACARALLAASVRHIDAIVIARATP